MVALASPATASTTVGRRGYGWTVATAALLIVGVGIRLALGGGGVGDRSAVVMAVLLGLGAWAAAVLLATPRTAFLVTLGALALFDLAALPPRNQPVYDDRQALYRTDQAVSVEAPIAPGPIRSEAVLTVLAEPVFGAAQPTFGLAGTINGTPLAWGCTFRHGLQRLALPVPAAIVTEASTADVRLQLTGAPTRESDYLLVYASSLRGGFVVSLVDAADVDQATTTLCAAQ